MRKNRLYINILILILIIIVLSCSAPKCAGEDMTSKEAFALADFLLWQIVHKVGIGAEAKNSNENAGKAEAFELLVDSWSEKKEESLKDIKKDAKQLDDNVEIVQIEQEIQKESSGEYQQDIDDVQTDSRDTNQGRSISDKPSISEETSEDKATEETTEETVGEKIYSATYEGRITDLDFDVYMYVSFTGDKKVTGSVTHDWGVSYLATTIDGKIDLSNYKIVAECEGVFVYRETDTKEDVNMIIYGTLNQDLKTFNGILVTELGEKSFSAAQVSYVTDL